MENEPTSSTGCGSSAVVALAMWVVLVVAGLVAAAGRGSRALVAAGLVASLSVAAMYGAWWSRKRGPRA